MADDDVEERIKRWKAEDKARSFEEKALKWEQRYVTEHQQLERLKGAHQEVKTQLSQVNVRKENAIREMYNMAVERDKYKRLREEVAGERDDAKLNFERLQRDYKVVSSKYEKEMETTLNLSHKLTATNEEYLDLAQRCELLQGKLTRTRNEAKKILKIKV